MQHVRTLVRIIWIVAGLGFFIWQFQSFQAQGFDFERLNQTPEIYISENGPAIEVMPIERSEAVGLIFYPGGMVDPNAYLPLAHALADRGYPVIIVKLPYRSAPRSVQEAAVHSYVRATINDSIITHWAIGGHSRGGVLATHFVHQYPTVVDALILIGTTHPKEAVWSLAKSRLPVTKIYGTADGIADPTTVLANRHLLPAHAQLLPIKGGNHSQFGYYGKQLGDGRATISRAEQQAQLVEMIANILGSLQNP